jgi:hypothetical protein
MEVLSKGKRQEAKGAGKKERIAASAFHNTKTCAIFGVMLIFKFGNFSSVNTIRGGQW